MEQIKADFAADRFSQVIAALETVPSDPSLKSETLRLLGLSYLRSGQLQAAELPLLRAQLSGDLECAVEYGNLLRATGRHQEAVAHLEALQPSLSGELLLRCWRWLGVAIYQNGDAAGAVALLERSWHGYLVLGHEDVSARVCGTLAQLCAVMGNHRRAEQLFRDALPYLSEAPNPLPRLTVLHGLAALQLQQGHQAGASVTLDLIDSALKHTDSLRARSVALTVRSEFKRLSGQLGGYRQDLETIFAQAEALQDHQMRVWATGKLSEHLSAIGETAEAMRLLAAYGEAQRDWPAELWAAYGMLQLRLTHPAESEAALLTAADLLRRGGRSPELIRVLMHAGGAALKCGDPDRAVKHLHEALFEMLRLKLHAEFRPDFEELQELLYHALLDPDTAPLLAPLLDNLAHLALPQGPRPMNSRSHLQLHTLGRTAVFCGGERVELNLRGSALLLGYLTLHPDQTRAQLQLALYPDKEENTGAGYIRSAVAQLRETLGPDVIVTSGPRNAPKYRLGPDVACDFDVVAFRAAARAGELRRMLGVYRGAFLQGIEDSPWVRDVREELLATLSLACHAELERLQDAREWRRLILLANRLLSLDPHDTRALELRMQAAEAGGNVQERASYAVEFRRSLN